MNDQTPSRSSLLILEQSLSNTTQLDEDMIDCIKKVEAFLRNIKVGETKQRAVIDDQEKLYLVWSRLYGQMRLCVHNHNMIHRDILSCTKDEIRKAFPAIKELLNYMANATERQYLEYCEKVKPIVDEIKKALANQVDHEQPAKVRNKRHKRGSGKSDR